MATSGVLIASADAQEVPSLIANLDIERFPLIKALLDMTLVSLS